MNYLSFTLAFFAGTCGKAVRDIIKFHWNICIFNQLLPKNSKTWKWFRSDWRDKPKNPPLSWSLFAPLWNGWHCGDFISYVLLGIALYNCNNFIEFIICLTIFWTFFELFYKYIYRINFEKNIFSNTIFDRH